MGLCRIPKDDTQLLEQPKRQLHVGRVLRRCKAALPALTGALIAAAAAAFILSHPPASAKGAVEDAPVAYEEGKVGAAPDMHDHHCLCANRSADAALELLSWSPQRAKARSAHAGGYLCPGGSAVGSGQGLTGKEQRQHETRIMYM